MEYDMGEVFNEVKEDIAKITHAEYKITERYLKLDEEILYDRYREKVAEVLSRKADKNALKELWQSDDLARSFIYVYYNTHGFDILTGREFVKRFDVVGENLLDQRFRGIHELIESEGFIRCGLAEFLDQEEIKEIIEDESFALRYPLTHLLLKKIFEIKTSIEEKYQTEMTLIMEQVTITSKYGKYEVKSFYPKVYHTRSYDEDIIEDAIKGVMAMKEFWEKWTKAREEIAHSLGIEDEAFMIRDLLEGILGFPLWTIMIDPVKDGWDLTIDLKYADARRKKLNLSIEQWYSMSKLIKAEFRRTNGKPIFRIYSLPILLCSLLGKAVGPDVVKKMVKILYEEKRDIATYLFDRSNLDELTKLSPLLANISNSLIDLLDSIKLNGQKVSLANVETVWTDLETEPFYVKTLSAGDPFFEFYCENDNWECMEVSLTTNIEYSDDIVSFVFKIVEIAEKLNDIKNKIEDFLRSVQLDVRKS